MSHPTKVVTYIASHSFMRLQIFLIFQEAISDFKLQQTAPEVQTLNCNLQTAILKQQSAICNLIFKSANQNIQNVILELQFVNYNM